MGLLRILAYVLTSILIAGFVMRTHTPAILLQPPHVYTIHISYHSYVACTIWILTTLQNDYTKPNKTYTAYFSYAHSLYTALQDIQAIFFFRRSKNE